MGAIKSRQDRKKDRGLGKHRDSFFETIEQIAMAFILAFLCQQFVVQAFVIPTGSMGPTLYGAHYEFTCRDCGYSFAVSGDARLDAPPVCPSCFLPQRDAGAAAAYSGAAPPYGGDRILALRFAYDFEDPARWDVIVFRNPNDASQNYIKRLVGLPGEAIQVVRGDVWIDGQIARKTDKAQQALWQIVHDTRYRPTRADWQPRWAGAGGGWAAQGTGFVLGPPATSASPSQGKPSWLTYTHRDISGRPINIRDNCFYNAGSQGPPLGSNVVTDLSLKAAVTAPGGQSVLVIEMRAWKDRFRFELGAGSQPSRVLLNDKVVGQSAGGVLPVGESVEIEAANVDRKLMLLVGGRRVVVAEGDATTEGDIEYEPSAASLAEMERLHNLIDQESHRHGRPLTSDERLVAEETVAGGPGQMLAEVRLGAVGPVTVGWLRLDRDVYYTGDEPGALPMVEGHMPAAVGAPYALRDNKFFVLGDNSPRSFDARLWPLPRSVVPRGNLIGRAFFVWLPGFGPRYHLPLAPDFKGFRMIH